ncbi:hypothetical protein [Deinococcus humi]|uniref:Uncharacterized protein n=1 Tax=Deinococcus humi TaxID=662880 RepID=A0A7W8JQB2_9DEIO|nr:hypothetical protein [Deinococcus humi]MBB5361222.1 hypothetical protein [Deinococcus humi]GGO19024.1 hypothetical protein GCM10008949_02900 [Deinococcus humi]
MKMKPLLRALALGVGPVMVAAGLGMVGGRSMPPEKLALAPPQLACAQPIVFKPGYQRGENYVVPQGQGFKFLSDAWLEANICSAGILKITADGELGGDEQPRLLVAFDGDIIANPAFSQERSIQISIPKAGSLYLGYLNDFYSADVRVATLSYVQLNAPACKGFQSVSVPKGSGNSWYPAARSVSLVNLPPITLTPCGAGELTLKVRGSEGNGAFPILIFRQGERVFKTLTTTSEWQPLSFKLTSAPIDIWLINPYNKTLADRNLKCANWSSLPANPEFRRQGRVASRTTPSTTSATAFISVSVSVG